MTALFSRTFAGAATSYYPDETSQMNDRNQSSEFLNYSFNSGLNVTKKEKEKLKLLASFERFLEDTFPSVTQRIEKSYLDKRAFFRKYGKTPEEALESGISPIGQTIGGVNGLNVNTFDYTVKMYDRIKLLNTAAIRKDEALVGWPLYESLINFVKSEAQNVRQRLYSFEATILKPKISVAKANNLNALGGIKFKEGETYMSLPEEKDVLVSLKDAVICMKHALTLLKRNFQDLEVSELDVKYIEDQFEAYKKVLVLPALKVPKKNVQAASRPDQDVETLNRLENSANDGHDDIFVNGRIERLNTKAAFKAIYSAFRTVKRKLKSAVIALERKKEREKAKLYTPYANLIRRDLQPGIQELRLLREGREPEPALFKKNTAVESNPKKKKKKQKREAINIKPEQAHAPHPPPPRSLAGGAQMNETPPQNVNTNNNTSGANTNTTTTNTDISQVTIPKASETSASSGAQGPGFPVAHPILAIQGQLKQKAEEKSIRSKQRPEPSAPPLSVTGGEKSKASQKDHRVELESVVSRQRMKVDAGTATGPSLVEVADLKGSIGSKDKGEVKSIKESQLPATSSTDISTKIDDEVSDMFLPNGQAVVNNVDLDASLPRKEKSTAKSNKSKPAPRTSIKTKGNLSKSAKTIKSKGKIETAANAVAQVNSFTSKHDSTPELLNVVYYDNQKPIVLEVPAVEKKSETVQVPEKRTEDLKTQISPNDAVSTMITKEESNQARLTDDRENYARLRTFSSTLSDLKNVDSSQVKQFAFDVVMDIYDWIPKTFGSNKDSDVQASEPEVTPSATPTQDVNDGWFGSLKSTFKEYNDRRIKKNIKKETERKELALAEEEESEEASGERDPREESKDRIDQQNRGAMKRKPRVKKDTMFN